LIHLTWILFSLLVKNKNIINEMIIGNCYKVFQINLLEYFRCKALKKKLLLRFKTFQSKQ